jgi:hypothetical protein
MGNKILWHGSLPGSSWPTDKTLYKGSDMTAISALYDPANQNFVIAADGRCNGITDTRAMVVLTNSEQKIFHTQTKLLTVAYAISGLARSANGSFDTMAEITKHIRALSMRPFPTVYRFIEVFSSKMEKTIENALANGTFPPLPRQGELPPDEVGRAFRLYLLGFYHKKPFGIQARFYVDMETRKASTRRHDFDISTFCLCCTGSDPIAEMIYGKAAVDPRIARHKRSDPCASEIDRDCSMIGGHIHAAEITQSGFRWLILPAAQGELNS